MDNKKYQEQMSGCLSLDEVREILKNRIPFADIILNKGIVEFYSCTEPAVDCSIGISYESCLGDDASQNRYIINLFWNDEYINSDGDYSRDELMQSEDLCTQIQSKWNECVIHTNE